MKTKINNIKNSKLFKNTFIYTFMQLINKGLPFFLLPILTTYLSPEDYGVLSLLNTSIGLISVFIGLSAAGIVNVHFFKDEKNELAKLIANIFYILGFTFIISFLVTYLFRDFIYEKASIEFTWVIIILIIALMQQITGINLTLWRSEQRAKPFAIYEISETFVNLVVTLFLIIIIKLTWEGRILGIFTASLIFGILSVYFIIKRDYYKANFSKDKIKESLKFGIPLIPHQLALWGKAGVDVLLITTLLGASYTGIYTVGYQFASIISILIFSFFNAYSPYIYEKLKNINEYEKVKIVKNTYLLFIILFIITISLSYLITFMVPYIVGKEFIESRKYIFLFSIAFLFQGYYLLSGLYIFYAKKTHLISYITLSGTIIHIILSYIFIKQYGAIGAAYSSIISYFLTFIGTWYLSNKVYKMPWFDFKGSK